MTESSQRAGRPEVLTFVLVVLLAFPWLNPFVSGPAPAVIQWLVTATCMVSVALMVTRWHIDDGVNAVALAWLVAALVSSLIGLLQYFGGNHLFHPWISETVSGEAFANLRQRNQFATLTNIGLMGLFWFAAQAKVRLTFERTGETGRLLAAMMLAWGNAVSGSRTGMLELIVVAALFGIWGYWREAPIRRILAVVFVSYGFAILVFPILAGWGMFGHGILERISRGDPLCGSRLTLWSNVLHLIRFHPWQGWGWGELDYAHFMTLYTGPRFCEILGNAHNLPLHLAVELGLPVAVLVCGAMVGLVGLAKPWRETEPTRQLAWGVLALIAVHSMLEYPLWYGPFQMAAGLSIGLLWWRPHAAPTRMSTVSVRGLRAVAVALLLAVSYAAWDYYRVSQIYLAPEQRAAAYREDTLGKIRDSWLFRDQVRFAELTLTSLTPQNARQLNAMAHDLLHFSPEVRVVEKLIESASLLGRDHEAQAFMLRYQKAYPQAYAQWVKARAE